MPSGLGRVPWKATGVHEPWGSFHLCPCTYPDKNEGAGVPHAILPLRHLDHGELNWARAAAHEALNLQATSMGLSPPSAPVPSSPPPMPGQAQLGGSACPQSHLKASREKHQSAASHTCPGPGTKPATQACALTRNQTRDLSVHRKRSNQLSHNSQGRVGKNFNDPARMRP